MSILDAFNKTNNRVNKYQYSTAIVDDEADARNVIELLLDKYFPDLALNIIASGVEEATTMLALDPPDILFLDINLGRSNGFDLLQRLNLNDTLLIFVTAYKQFALKAIKNAAFDYLLKPVDIDEFRTTVNKAIGRLAQRSNRAQYASQIALPSLYGYDFIDYSSIVYCEADGNYTIVHLTNNKKHVVSCSLVRFEEQLQGYDFLRIHHKYVINMAQLKSYRKGKGGGSVLLTNNKEVEVSVRKKNELLKKIITI